MQRGRRIAFDVGSARIGVAICDPDGILASPLDRIDRTGDELDRVKLLLAEYEPVAIYVGLPISLEAKFTQSTFESLYFAEDIETITTTRVRLVDERLSTKMAQANLHESGRNTRTSKAVIDSASAVEILERALDVLKAGREAGKTVDAINESLS
jgi:putative Holliday junction resolvase